jgi:hypothetical protein
LRGKPTAAKSWLRGWKTAAWMKPLFERIYEPSTASRGVGSWIASLAATRASRSPPQGSGRATGTNGTCGPKSPASSEKSAPSGASSRTSATTYEWASRKSTTTFRDWVIELRQVCLQRKKSALHINGSDYSSSQEGSLLPTSHPWARPLVGEEQALQYWPTPNALGGRGYITGAKADTWRPNLQSAVYGYRPVLHKKTPSHPDQVTSLNGMPSSPYGQNSPLRLNPTFVEWLMGWPIGWTACGRAATESYRQWRHSHGGPSLAA